MINLDTLIDLAKDEDRSMVAVVDNDEVCFYEIIDGSFYSFDVSGSEEKFERFHPTDLLEMLLEKFNFRVEPA